MRPMTEDVSVATADAHARWQELAASSTSASVLDVVRRVAVATSPWPILVRALVVTPVYLRLGDGGRVETSRSDGDDYLHAYSTPVRLTAGLGADVEEITIREAFVADLVVESPGLLGVRIDPGLDTEQAVPPPMAQEVVAVAAGLPVPAALTPAEGEELRVEAGPAGVTDLDRRVLTAVREADPDARVRRAAATLLGIGGRLWPVYAVTGAAGDAPTLADRVQRAARVPVVLLVDGRPPALTDLLDVDARGVDLSQPFTEP